MHGEAYKLSLANKFLKGKLSRHVDKIIVIQKGLSKMKAMWDLIQVTHEGTIEVRRSRKDSLIQEYETFQMQQGETIRDVQKRFTHIVNHLKGLGIVFEEEELNVKY